VDSKSNRESISWFVHEGEMMRLEIINRRLTWALLAALAVAAGAVIALIVR